MTSSMRMTLRRTLTLRTTGIRHGGAGQGALRRTLTVKGLKSIFKEATTQLIEAAWEGDVELVKTLCYGGQVDPNCKDKDGYTPLHYACSNGHNEIAEILVECGAKTDIRDKDGKHILHHVCYFGNLDILKYLLGKGCDVNVMDSDSFTGNRGKSLLHYSAASGHYEITKLLLAYKANANAKDRWGSFPLHYACYYVHAPEKKWNIPKPEKFLKFILNSIVEGDQGGEGFKRVHYIDEGDDEIERQEQARKDKYYDFMKIVALLIAHGSNPDGMNNNGKCPFDYCGTGKKRDKLLFYMCKNSGKFSAVLKAEVKRMKGEIDEEVAERKRKEDADRLDEAERLKKEDEIINLAHFQELMKDKPASEESEESNVKNSLVQVDLQLGAIAPEKKKMKETEVFHNVNDTDSQVSDVSSVSSVSSSDVSSSDDDE